MSSGPTIGDKGMGSLRCNAVPMILETGGYITGTEKSISS